MKYLVRFLGIIAVLLLITALLLLGALVLLGAAVQTVGEFVATVFHALMSREFWIASAERLGEVIRTGQVRK